jgi:hypothetical protein
MHLKIPLWRYTGNTIYEVRRQNENSPKKVTEMKKVVETKKSPEPSTKNIPEKSNDEAPAKRNLYHFTKINVE